MSHTVQPMPKCSIEWHRTEPLSAKCELTGNRDKSDDTSPCSHFDHCEREATVWIYTSDHGPACFGLCNACYNWCYPTNEQWYRVVRVSDKFEGKL